MNRTPVLVFLLGAYAAVALRGSLAGMADRTRFDPFLPLARAVELRIGERRFAEALPIARGLRQTYPREPLVAYWLARIHHGLDAPRAEVEAWENYVRLSPAPEEACPALPQAYARLGLAEESLAAYRRCVEFSPDDVDRLSDLGEAYARAGRKMEARAAFEHACRLDPENPAFADRVAALTEQAP